MQISTLFPQEQLVGVFKGFQEGGLEFHADLVLPYQKRFQRIPMHGQFVLVQLESPREAVLGRIVSMTSDGSLSRGTGEEFIIRAVFDGRNVPEDVREQYLKYRVNIRVLGVVRLQGNGHINFVASHRRLPHMGSPVAFPSDDILREIARHNSPGAPIGHLAYGEYIYAEGSDDLDRQEWMQIQSPEILVKFPIEDLVSRRTFVFARAGFGKSNLMKLLFSLLYKQTPTTIKRGNRRVPVGTVLFDPDGEYFWPDDKGRPGLCDVPDLKDKIVVFTPRQAPSPFYGSFVAGGIKLNIKRLRPADVISIALSADRQDQQNVRKLKAMPQDRWEQLVDIIHKDGNQASLKEISRLLSLDKELRNQDVEAIAARSNMTNIVKTLHDPNSLLLEKLKASLKVGKICIIDISQMSSEQSLKLSGLILRNIFNHNQEEFTKANPQTIPTIAVIEEAQSVLDNSISGINPYIEWVKEGRKYDLGAVLITQQPGSIPTEILSQGDNWFIFHLLSATDLINLKRANAHFSDDLLSSLLNEPIPGHGIFWSSVAGMSYPLPIRVLSFERMYSPQDPFYNRPAERTFASEVNTLFERKIMQVTAAHSENGAKTPADPASIEDPIAQLERSLIVKFCNNQNLLQKLLNGKVSWAYLMKYFHEQIPEDLDGQDMAYYLVPKAMRAKFGEQGEGWDIEKIQDEVTGKWTTYMRILKVPDEQVAGKGDSR